MDKNPQLIKIEDKEEKFENKEEMKLNEENQKAFEEILTLLDEIPINVNFIYHFYFS